MFINQNVTNDIKESISEFLVNDYKKEKINKWKKIVKFPQSKKRKLYLHNEFC